MDISSLSLQELIELQEQTALAIAAKKQDAKQQLILEFNEKASACGLTLSELFGKPKKQKNIDSTAKYMHPGNAELTWSGKGRKPFWVLEWEKGGGTLEQLK